MVNVYYDLETTGLNWYHDQIIEIGAVMNNNSFSELCNIGDTILPKRITDITGIGKKDLINAPEESIVLKSFFRFIKKDCKNKTVYLIAHNNHNFDKWFILSRTNQHSIRIPNKWKFIDSLLLAKLLLPGLNSFRLSTLCSMFNIIQESAHRAEDDSKCLMKVFEQLLKMYKTKFNVKDSDDIMEDVWKRTNLSY